MEKIRDFESPQKPVMAKFDEFLWKKAVFSGFSLAKKKKLIRFSLWQKNLIAKPDIDSDSQRMRGFFLASIWHLQEKRSDLNFIFFLRPLSDKKSKFEKSLKKNSVKNTQKIRHP